MLARVSLLTILVFSGCLTSDAEPRCRSDADCGRGRCEATRCVSPEEACCTCLIGLTCINAAATQESCLEDIRNDQTSDFSCVVPTSGCGDLCGFLLPTDGEPCFGDACDETSVCVDPDTFEGPEPATCRALCSPDDEPACRVGTCALVAAGVFACVPA